MSQASNNLDAYSWSIADLLRGDFRQSQYGRIILPFTLLQGRPRDLRVFHLQGQHAHQAPGRLEHQTGQHPPVVLPPLGEQKSIVEYLKTQTFKFDAIMQEAHEAVPPSKNAAPP